MQTATKDEKGKVKTTKSGRVIGQEFVKGRQLKGESGVEFQEAAEATEIDITDALDKERVPRIYRKAVRNYFDRSDGRAKPPGDDAEKSGEGDESKSSGEGEPESPDSEPPAKTNSESNR